jgi:pyruvate,water dikinase
MAQTTPPTAWIRWFADLSLDDIPLVGGKNASLGELSRTLAGQGVRVPNGYAITADAYRFFLREAHLEQTLQAILAAVNPHDLATLRQGGRQVRQAILAAPLPPALTQAITEAYAHLSAASPEPVDVAVRSSATAEDLPTASFAGQQETYLNVQGTPALLEACKRCFASLFTDRAISYRADKGFDHAAIALAIGVQRMVRADLATAGVMFSLDPETGFRDAVLINAAYGLGENVVQGVVNPDEYTVFKPTLRQGFRPILQKRLGSKEFKLVYDVGGSKLVKNVPVPAAERARFALTDDEILTGPASLKTITAPGGGRRAPWTWNGLRTARRASCSWCRRVPKPCNRNGPWTRWKCIISRPGARCWRAAAAWGRKFGRARCG